MKPENTAAGKAVRRCPARNDSSGALRSPYLHDQPDSNQAIAPAIAVSPRVWKGSSMGGCVVATPSRLGEIPMGGVNLADRPQTEVGSPTIDLPEFDQKLASDPQFAESRSARLNWFYQHSPWWDSRLGLYPVRRLSSISGLPLE